mgnify:FL=1
MTSADSAALRREALGVLMPGFVGTMLPDWLTTLLRDGLGGVCLFGHNVDSPAQVASLTAATYAANPRAIIAIDEEGGDVSRLHQHDGSPFPGNAVLGRIDDVETTRAVAHEVGEQLASVGVHLTLAPVADVNCNPDNPVIGVRSFGADAAAVAAHTAAWVEGVQAAGVAACAKHFPGHGDTAADSHVAEPVVSADAATLDARELAPFRAAIAAGTKTIMTSHIRVPALDPDAVATFSSTILGDVLRDRLGFDGVVVTDALDMVGASGERGIPAAAVAAVSAGADLLCLGSNNAESEIEAVVDALMGAVDTATLPHGRLTDGDERCLALADWLADRRRQSRAAAPAAAPEPVVGRRQVAASFTLSDHATAVLGSGPRQVRWVKIEPEPNIAVGETPFGPFFAGGAVPSLVVPIDDRGLADTYVAEPGALTVVVGRELHRDEGASAAATTVAAGCVAIVVDMGFTPGDRVDVATFGASRLVGEALLDLVEADARSDADA